MGGEYRFIIPIFSIKRDGVQIEEWKTEEQLIKLSKRSG